MNNIKRKRLRIKNYNYSENGAYFITICIYNKVHIFGEIIDGSMHLNHAGKMVEMHWLKLPNRFCHIKLDEYMVMPNHFHGIVFIDKPNMDVHLIDTINSMQHIDTKISTYPSIGHMIGTFKSITAHAYIKGIKNFQWPIFDKKLWQRNYYEHVIRDDKALQKIREYIIHNPINWDIDEMNASHHNTLSNK